MQTTVVDEPWIAADPIQSVSVDEPWIAPEPIHALAVGLLEEPSIVPLSASLDESSVDEPPAGPVVDEASINLSGELEELSVHADSLVVDDVAAGVFTITSDDHDTSVFDLMDHVPGILEPPSILEGVEAALDQIAAAARLRPEPRRARRRRAATPAERRGGRRQRVAPRGARGAATGCRLVGADVPDARAGSGRALEGVPAETPAAHAEQPDWIELVASLRQDLERRRTDPASSADPVAARPSDGADARMHRLVKKPKMPARKTKPVQDEWGFFDPERCGFSTLLAKLEEITEIS